MDYEEIIATILRYCGQGTGGDFEKMVKVLINYAYFDVLDSAEIPQEERVTAVSSVADSSQLGLPLYIKKVLNVEDPTNNRFVYETTRTEFDRHHPGTTASGTPHKSFPIGVRGVQAQPADDGVLALVSDAAGDAGANYLVRVTGYNTTGS